MLKNFRPRIPVKEARYLNLEEVRKLLLHVEERPYEVAVWLGIYMGLRIGEIQALRWEDVDIDQGVLHVRRTYSMQNFTHREPPDFTDGSHLISR